MIVAACGNNSAGSGPATVTAPLTGLQMSAVFADRPALSIKVDNSPYGLPQSGINRADLVSEALVEGGLTRLLATYQSEDAASVGPIRSARPVDAALLRALGGGIFAYSGAAAGEIAPVRASSTATLLSPSDTNVFQVVRTRSAPYDVFASTSQLYSAGKAAGASMTPPPQIFSYGAAPPEGRTVSHASIPMSGVTTASWAYSPSQSAYQRSQNGKPVVLSDGSQVTATNLVVLSVSIGHTGIYDAAGHEDPLVVVVGSGSAWVLRDGQLYTGTWSRPSIDSPTQVTDSSGAVIPLRPGRTWVELLPRGNQPSFY
jgi:hypothetical protein